MNKNVLCLSCLLYHLYCRLKIIYLCIRINVIFYYAVMKIFLCTMQVKCYDSHLKVIVILLDF